MQQETLRAQRREESGSRPSRRLRADGLVPAVVYGRGLEPQPVSVSDRELYGVLHSAAGLNAIIELHVEDGDAVLTVAREIQRHPVRGDITHLDFIKVSLDEAIEAEVGIEYVGTPAGVKEGGILEMIENSVSISALPTQIPPSIEVDVSELEIGQGLRIADLPAIDGVTYLADEDRPLVTVIVPAAAPVEEEVEEGLELLEGLEEGEAEEGAEPAAEEGAEADDET